MKAICFVIQTPLMLRDYERYGVERLLKQEFEVYFFDLTMLYNPQMVKNKMVEQFDYKNIIPVKTSQDIIDWFVHKQHKQTFIVDLTGRDDIQPLFENIVKNREIYYGLLCTNSIPRVKYKILLQHLISLTSWKLLFEKIKNKFVSHRKTFTAPDFIIAGSNADRRIFPMTGPTTKIIWTHTLDYDLYLEYQSKPRSSLINGEYAIFLDECFPLHPDYHVSGNPKNPFRSYQEYYQELNYFFDVIEEKIGMPIVIAAHPRAPYEKMPDLFKERKVIKNRSLDLVAGSRWVISHASTALNFAVLFHKPIIFIMPEKVKGKYYGRFMSNFARHFNKKHFDRKPIADLDPSKEMLIDHRAYETYKEEFIKIKGTPEENTWDIAGKFFQQFDSNERLHLVNTTNG